LTARLDAPSVDLARTARHASRRSRARDPVRRATRPRRASRSLGVV